MRTSMLALVMLLAGAISTPTVALGPADIRVRSVFPGIGAEAPLALVAAPGDVRHLYVALQDGRILRINRTAGTASTFLDIRGRVNQQGGEMGLLGLAFDPGFATNGYLYVNYVTPSPLRTVIARFERTADGSIADPGSEHELLSFAQPYANHKGGWIGIGPDRHLYIASGDGGSPGDSQNNAQRLDTLLGKTLRITRSGAIPQDNPFVGIVGARGEIWAYGLRNPFRMSFDSVTGALWAGDVGQSQWEEVNLIRRGGNYGWRIFEGNHNYNNPLNLPPSDFTAPIHEYTRGEGCSVIGGVVYRGAAIPALVGRYVYTDYCSGTLWALQLSDGVVQSNIAIGDVVTPTSIGEDQDGELYVTLRYGAILRIESGDGGADQDFPQFLSQTGLFAETELLVPAADMIEYDVRAGFWSDGARKRRWFRLPVDGRVGFEPVQAWRFPVGSATVKHFEVTTADGSARRLETRVFRRLGDGWRGATYRWNDAQSDAALVTATETELLHVRTANGAVREQMYEYPSQSACMRCHTASAGVVLGLSAPQLNRKFLGSSVNQLESFSADGLFSTDIGDVSRYQRLANPYDTTLGLSSRARAYLHVNCSQCHRPNGPTGVDMDLRWNRPIGQTNTINIVPTGDTLGISGALRIAPGDPQKSLVWRRLRRLDSQRMPPLGTHVIDAKGVELIGSWIRAGAS